MGSPPTKTLPFHGDTDLGRWIDVPPLLNCCTSCSNTLFFVTTFRGQVPCGDSSYPFGIFEMFQTFHLTLQVSCYVCMSMAQSSPRRLTFSFILIWFVIESAPFLVHLHIQFTFTFTTDWTQGYPGKVKRTFELRTAIVTRKLLSGIILILMWLCQVQWSSLCCFRNQGIWVFWS